MKKPVRFFGALLISVVILEGTGVVAYAYEPPHIIDIGEVHTRSDIIDWRYKTENGKMYKRLYKFTTYEWIEPRLQDHISQ